MISKYKIYCIGYLIYMIIWIKSECNSSIVGFIISFTIIILLFFINEAILILLGGKNKNE